MRPPAAVAFARGPASTRSLAISGAVFSGAAVLVTLAAIALDRQPPAFIAHVASIAILEIGVAAAFISVVARGMRPPGAAPALIATAVLLLVMPVLVPHDANATRFVVALWSGVLLMKCVDLYVGSRQGSIDPRTAFPFLFASNLVLRNAQLPGPRSEPVLYRLMLSAAGTALLVLAFRIDWTPWPFLLEHSVKFCVFAAASFPACNALMSMTRALGGSARDFSNAPALSRTPAEFWRRYNRIVGQFLLCDVGRAAGGVHAPVAAAVAAFVFSAALHEYLLATAVGRALGYQTAFFALQALAVLATMRIAPRGVAAAVGTLLTVAFMILTATLFGANVHMAVPIYSNPLPAWLAW